MGTLEIIDRLCAVTSLLAEIVKEQTIAIAQSEIAEEVKAELMEKQNKADEELDLLEYKMRRL